MTTFKQAIRAANRANNSYKREQKKRSNEAARRFKEQQKQQEISDAAEAVLNYENYVNSIVSIHKNASSDIDWVEILNEPPPAEPVLMDKFELEAQNRLDNFQPSIFNKIFGSKNKIKKLQKAVEQGKLQDQKLFEDAKSNYDDWKELQEIAKGVESKKPESYGLAITYFNPFEDIAEFGSKITGKFESNLAEMEFHVHTEEVIPNFILSQTKTGKLSKKDMPKGKLYELFQDYVCSGFLRVARETMAIVPVETVLIHAMVEIINSQTGHKEEGAIVSTVFDRAKLYSLNFETIDPSDSLQNFQTKMKFKKTQGFEIIEKISTTEVKV